KVAAELVGHHEPGLRTEYLNRYASALREYGDYRGDNAVLTQAIAVYRAALAEIRREELSLTWAATQDNLGNALQALGEREGRDGAAGGSGDRVSRGVEGIHAGARAVGLGDDAEQRAWEVGRTGERDGAAGGSGDRVSRGVEGA